MYVYTLVRFGKQSQRNQIYVKSSECRLKCKYDHVTRDYIYTLRITIY